MLLVTYAFSENWFFGESILRKIFYYSENLFLGESSWWFHFKTASSWLLTLIGPEPSFDKFALVVSIIWACRFFSARLCWTMIGTPFSGWPDSPIARGTDWVNLNSIYAIPIFFWRFSSSTYNQLLVNMGYV